jgi:alkanesulfonate monooxygenase SsuD/methylene tetrahydromethanopterin reductase-like flavin-dependent oxidoreductase (luciferase family)
VQVGVGLPTQAPECDRDLLVTWATTADAAGFSTLSAPDLLTTPAWDPLAALAATAAVTEHARIMTNVLVLPLRREGVVATEAATIDALSRGRLTLGLGAGGRKPVLFEITGDPGSHSNFPDYAAAPAERAGRSARLDEQVAYLRRIWSGAAPRPGVPPVGPAPVRPGGPELLAGVYAPAAVRRATAWADGFACFSHGADRDLVAPHASTAWSVWRDAARPGVPRLVGSCLFALGPRAGDGTAAYIARHYCHLSTEGRAMISEAIGPPGEAAARRAAAVFADAGFDELVFVPMIGTVEQVRRLADLGL